MNKTPLIFIVFAIVLVACGAQKEAPKRHRNGGRKRPPTFGKSFDGIPPNTGYKKPVPPFPFFEGATFVPSFKPGEKVWTPIPVAGAWDIVNYSIAKVQKIKATSVRLVANGTEFVVPGAMLVRAERPKKRLRRGAPVLCALSMTSEWGKVLKTTKGTVLVGMIWAKEEEKKQVSVDELLLLSRKKNQRGAPVVFKRGRSWEFGQLIYRNRTTSWIIAYAGKLIIKKNYFVRMVPMRITYKPKQRVWTRWYDILEEAKVEKVLLHGAGYLVRFPGRPKQEYRNPRAVSFARMVKPLG